MKRLEDSRIARVRAANVKTRVINGETGRCREHKGVLVGRDLGKVQKVVEELGDVAPRYELVEDLRCASVENGSDELGGTMLKALRAA